MVHIVLEWGNHFLPGWMVLWEGTDREDFTQLNDIGNLELLKLEVRVEGTIVELAEEAH